MKTQFDNPRQLISSYSRRLQSILLDTNWTSVELLAIEMLDCWRQKKQVFICGNGGSAGNAIHLANDFLYGVAKQNGGGLKVQALSANPAVMTCLANDIGYDHIYSEQLAVLGQRGDLLIVLSGSGNSPNILRVLQQSKGMAIKSAAILGFDGGECKRMADIPIHFEINDMQIAEDMQLIVGHMMMQWLYSNRPQ